VQDLFTEYGCSIKTRLGLHTVSEGFYYSSPFYMPISVGINEQETAAAPASLSQLHNGHWNHDRLLEGKGGKAEARQRKRKRTPSSDGRPGRATEAWARDSHN